MNAAPRLPQLTTRGRIVVAGVLTVAAAVFGACTGDRDHDRDIRDGQQTEQTEQTDRGA